jgi:hypothetical protein
MIDDVGWPDVANSAALHGKQAIRWYWHGAVCDCRSARRPADFIEAGDDLVVAIDQRIADLEGRPPAVPAVVFHRYTFGGDLVRRMVLFTDRDAAITELEGRAPDLPARDAPNDETERAPPRGNRSGTGRSAGTRPPGCALQNR